jgi:hypothetical protein
MTIVRPCDDVTDGGASVDECGCGAVLSRGAGWSGVTDVACSVTAG